VLHACTPCNSHSASIFVIWTKNSSYGQSKFNRVSESSTDIRTFAFCMCKFFEAEHKWHHMIIMSRTLVPSAMTFMAHLIDFLSAWISRHTVDCVVQPKKANYQGITTKWRFSCILYSVIFLFNGCQRCPRTKGNYTYQIWKKNRVNCFQDIWVSKLSCVFSSLSFCTFGIIAPTRKFVFQSGWNSVHL